MFCETTHSEEHSRQGSSSTVITPEENLRTFRKLIQREESEAVGQIPEDEVECTLGTTSIVNSHFSSKITNKSVGCPVSFRVIFLLPYSNL